MKRAQLEHILRAASRIVDERDFLVVGSAAALGTFDDDQLPLEASRSDEADLARQGVGRARVSCGFPSVTRSSRA